jgi:pimeloyl-ACP methyl ester carboxylesterase
MRRIPSTDGIAVALHHLAGTDEPDAPTWLLAHATGFCGLALRPLAAHLARLDPGARVVAPDQRWHGATGGVDGAPVRWTSMAEDLVAVVDDLGGAVHAVGHSMGGAALVLAATARPAAFASLWLYEPVIPSPELAALINGDTNPFAGAAARRRPGFASPADALANFSSKPPMASFDPDALAGYVEGGFAPGPEGGVVLCCPPAVEAAVYRAASGDAWAAAPSVTAPTVVARGAATGGGPAEWAERVAARLPAGTLAGFDDLGHFAPLEVPDRIAHAAVAAARA